MLLLIYLFTSYITHQVIVFVFVIVFVEIPLTSYISHLLPVPVASSPCQHTFFVTLLHFSSTKIRRFPKTTK